MNRSLVLIALAATLAACASRPALYQPMHDDVGYGEQMLEPNRYRVWFAGNSATPRETVEDYVLYRCAELTLDKGYDYFVLSDRTSEKEHARGGGPTLGLGLGGFRFGGRGGISIGIGTGIPLGGSDAKYFGQADAVLMKGKKPEKDPAAFDAREIRKNLEPSILRKPVE
jgi:hypothetical protein